MASCMHWRWESPDSLAALKGMFRESFAGCSGKASPSNEVLNVGPYVSLSYLKPYGKGIHRPDMRLYDSRDDGL